MDTISVFCELSNIGSGNASTSLAKMVNEVIDIGVPKSEINKLSDIVATHGASNEPVLATVLQLSEDMEGIVMIVIKVDSAYKLLSKLLRRNVSRTVNNLATINEELSSVRDVCNTLCGAYLSAISEMTNLNIVTSPPYFSVDNITTAMNLPASLYGPGTDSISCIETEFFTLDKEVEGKFYFIPKIDSCQKLLAALGLA